MIPASYTNRPTESTQKEEKKKRVLLTQNPFSFYISSKIKLTKIIGKKLFL